MSVWAKANPERARAITRRWQENNREKSRAHSRKWRLANPGKLLAIVTKWQEQNPEKRMAHIIVKRALLAERLVKMPCEECGATGRIHAHHEDYSRPLMVSWLCALHHRKAHRVSA